ncbi:hypothetical protein LV75_006953, partial [Actinokineospora diospyrosa]|nr:hypothetical protein [Actinokineospora diospyrosa]
WALGAGRWALGAGRWALGAGRWALGAGRWALPNGCQLTCLAYSLCSIKITGSWRTTGAGLAEWSEQRRDGGAQGECDVSAATAVMARGEGVSRGGGVHTKRVALLLSVRWVLRSEVVQD